ncbi:hypothetical protein D623_10015646 [Myotis brandtii]|uniref:Plasminogen receptor (KT) n=1 Tax=Myotis brandtii TaxID=109478 RepID=S7MKI9_MYOBR|nr:hypothetical protein D623_10015646 [Myotis brandtii]
MGFIFSKSMNENMKNQQEFMLMNARLQKRVASKRKELSQNADSRLNDEVTTKQLQLDENAELGRQLHEDEEFSRTLAMLDEELTTESLKKKKKLERQLMMQNEMRERQMAMQVAWSREFLKYFGTFFAIAAISLTAGAIKRKKPAFLFPIIPLGFVLTYQYDLGYGTLLQRMKGEAENILEKEKNKLQLPKGMITFESLEKARREQSKFFIDK